MIADLHIHTNASDGRLSPLEVVEQAIQSGLSSIAITDHDTIDGLLMLEQQGKLQNERLTIIPGIEFSGDLPDHEVHILGYNLDIYNKELREQLDVLIADRLQRTKKMIAKLAKLGYPIEFQRVLELAGRSTALGRPHVARALVERGYFATVTDVFNQLLYKNGPAFVDHYKLSIPDVIELIKKTGGFPVLAHPGLIGDDSIVMNIIRSGILGLEVFHPKHQPDEVKKYMRLASRYGLLVTGGSDFHAIPTRFPERLGIFSIDNQLAQKLITSSRQL